RSAVGALLPEAAAARRRRGGRGLDPRAAPLLQLRRRRAPAWRGRPTRPRDERLRRFRVPLRGRLGPPARRDGRGDRPREAGRGQRGATVSVPLGAFIAVSATLFFIGTAGVLVRRNAVDILMWVELMLDAAHFALVACPLRSRAVDER